MDEITRKIIEKRAYEIYEWRQSWGFEGSDLDDWFQAQLEVFNYFLSQGKSNGAV